MVGGPTMHNVFNWAQSTGRVSFGALGRLNYVKYNPSRPRLQAVANETTRESLKDRTNKIHLLANLGNASYLEP